MKSSKFRVIKQVLGFFESVLMGCFFGCFRIKDDARRKTNLCAESISFDDRVSLVPKEETASDSLLQGQEAKPSLAENFDDSSIRRDIENEAKFLKNCGAISKTPEEIRKTSNKTFSHTSSGDGLSSNFPSELSRSYDKNDDLDAQSDSTCHALAKLQNSLGFFENKFEGCILEVQPTVREVLQLDGKKHEAWIYSEPDSDLDISPAHSDCKPEMLDSSNSPFPTPLNLTDEMQTPGTVYSVNMDNLRTGKHTRIRSQYVYPVLKPVENLPQWLALRQDSCRHVHTDTSFERQLKSSRTDSMERRKKDLLGAAHKESNLFNSGLPFPSGKISQDGHVISTERFAYKQTPCNLELLSGSSDQVTIEPDTPELIVSSLSQWLKPRHLNNEIITSICNAQSFSEMNFDADRPIIGTVAAHWNEERSCNSPTYWNGNGIPNSTNKYKEDQRVSWHATPFEERLEKVLSDDKLLPQRKLLYRDPLELEDEGREIDAVVT